MKQTRLVEYHFKGYMILIVTLGHELKFPKNYKFVLEYAMAK